MLAAPMVPDQAVACVKAAVHGTPLPKFSGKPRSVRVELRPVW